MLIHKEDYDGMFPPGAVAKAADPWSSGGLAEAFSGSAYAADGSPQNDHARPVKGEDSIWPRLFGPGSPVLDPTIWSGPFQGLF